MRGMVGLVESLKRIRPSSGRPSRVVCGCLRLPGVASFDAVFRARRKDGVLRGFCR
jgi:hypothetical protein